MHVWVMVVVWVVMVMVVPSHSGAVDHTSVMVKRCSVSLVTNRANHVAVG